MEFENSDILYFLEQTRNFPGLRALAFKQLVNETSEDVALRILARFSVSLCEAIENINEGLSSDKADPVWKACHKLVGTAELLGFYDFGVKSKQLSQNIHASGELPHYRAELVEYLKDIQTLLDQINSGFPHLKSYF